MNRETAENFVRALREKVESITLTAKVLIEGGIIFELCKRGLCDDGYELLDTSVNVVHFSGWPTGADVTAPERFVCAWVPLSHPLLAPLSDRTLPVTWLEISRLPEIICRLAAEVLDGQQFKVRLITTDQELVESFLEDSDPWNTHERDMDEWRTPKVFCLGLEAWNEHGAIELNLGGYFLYEIFTEEILDCLRSAVAAK